MHTRFTILTLISWSLMILKDITISSSLPVISEENLFKSFTKERSNLMRYDLTSTITQVQRILENDPKLPRLTRGEIEDLFDQVTKDEFVNSLQGDDLSRALHMRSLMLVLPYNTDDSTEKSLQDLYTKPPITKVVENYSVPRPQKYPIIKSTIQNKSDIYQMIDVPPTTYKPLFAKRNSNLNSITTYHPRKPTTYHPSSKHQLNFTMSTTASSLKVDSEKIAMKTTSLSGSKSGLGKPDTVTEKTITLVDIENDYFTSDLTRYSSHYNAKKPEFKYPVENFKIPDKNSKQVGLELTEVLHNLGFAPDNQSQTQTMLDVKTYGGEVQQKPFISSLIKQKATAPVIPHRSSISADDFKRSMMAPKLTSDAYITFKPLKISENQSFNPEMEDYLSLFGIVPTSANKMITNGVKITNKQRFARNLQPETSPRASMTTKEIDKNENSNNNSDIAISSIGIDEQKNEDKQVQQLLKNIAQLEQLNVNLTLDRLKEVKAKLVNMQQMQGPEPNKAKEFNSFQKNEIKQQRRIETSEPTRFNFDLNLDSDYQEKDKITASRAIINVSKNVNNDVDTIATTSSPGSIVESQNGSLNDLEALEDSFGGLDPVTENPLPPQKKNGFYFLADWNSFLEVGEGEEQVVVRLSKKIGDGRRFIPVKIP